MASIRYVGTSFQFVGGIMSAEAFEDWCKAELDGWISKNGEDLAVSWFARRTRTKWKARRGITAQLQGSDEFRQALTEQLNHLPRVFDKLVALSAKVPLLTEQPDMRLLPSVTEVVAVPRAIVIDMFSKALCGELSQSAELGRLTHFADFYLRRVAEDAEAQLFHQGPPHARFGSSIVLGVASDFLWPKLATTGHYYVNYPAFGDGLQPALQRLEARLKNSPPDTLREAADTVLTAVSETPPWTASTSTPGPDNRIHIGPLE